jgi:hypothetical protein
MDSSGKAAYAAVEVVIWQLVASGMVPAEPLAAELGRYAGFSGNAAKMLLILSQVASAAARPALAVSPKEPPSKRRYKASQAGEGCSIPEAAEKTLARRSPI